MSHGRSAASATGPRGGPTQELEETREHVRRETSGVQETDLEKKSFKQKWLGGLRASLVLWIIVTASVVITNVVCFIVALTRYGQQNGYGTLQHGDCEDMKNQNFWYHLAVNALSTCSLLASGAYLQAAASPTRAEVEVAHQDKEWVSIGPISPRNLLKISWFKRIVVLALLLTTLPLHLLYNSVIFVTLATHQYNWAIVDDSFLQGHKFDLDSIAERFGLGGLDGYGSAEWLEFDGAKWGHIDIGSNGKKIVPLKHIYRDMQLHAERSWARMEPQECLRTYSGTLVPDNRNVVLVATTKNPENSILMLNTASAAKAGFMVQNNWLCSYLEHTSFAPCDTEPFARNITTWRPFGYEIKYCLSEEVPERCVVQYSTGIAIIVIFCTLAKLLLMTYFFFREDLSKLLVSVGDAIASFLSKEDQHTFNMSQASKKFIREFWTHEQVPVSERLYEPQKSRIKLEAISPWRWISSGIFLGILLVVVAGFFKWVIFAMTQYQWKPSFSKLYHLGFLANNVNQNLMIFTHMQFNPSIAGLALLANLPQLILAIVYFLWNGLIAALYTAEEYSKLAFGPTYLMVSLPAGKQRGTWILGQPISSGVLLLADQFGLHWFVSQSLFVVSINLINQEGALDSRRASPDGHLRNCSFSPLVIMIVLAIAPLIFILTGIIGCQRLETGHPPIVGNCSAAIAAACHPTSRPSSLPFRPLMYKCIHFDPEGRSHFAITAVDEKGEILRTGSSQRITTGSEDTMDSESITTSDPVNPSLEDDNTPLGSMQRSTVGRDSIMDSDDITDLEPESPFGNIENEHAPDEDVVTDVRASHDSDAPPEDEHRSGKP